MKNPLLEEIYAARDEIWKSCGETIDGYFRYIGEQSAKRRSPRVSAQPRRPRVRPLRASSRKNVRAK